MGQLASERLLYRISLPEEERENVIRESNFLSCRIILESTK